MINSQILLLVSTKNRAWRWKKYLHSWLSHRTKYWVVSADARPLLLVFCFRVAYLVEVGGWCKHRATKPDSIPLHLMSYDIHINGFWLNTTTTELLSDTQSCINNSLYVSLQAAIEVLKHSRPTRQNNILI